MAIDAGIFRNEPRCRFFNQNKKSLNYNINEANIVPLFTSMLCWEGVILTHAFQLAKILKLNTDNLIVLENGGFTMENMLDLLSFIIEKCTDNLNNVDNKESNIKRGTKRTFEETKGDDQVKVNDDKVKTFIKKIKTISREISESAKAKTGISEYLDILLKRPRPSIIDIYQQYDHIFHVGNTVSRKLFSCVDLLMRICPPPPKSQHTSHIESMVNYSVTSEDIVPLFTILMSWDHITRKYASAALQSLFGHSSTIEMIREVGLTVEDILQMFTYILEISTINFQKSLAASS